MAVEQNLFILRWSWNILCATSTLVSATNPTLPSHIIARDTHLVEFTFHQSTLSYKVHEKRSKQKQGRRENRDFRVSCFFSVYYKETLSAYIKRERERQRHSPCTRKLRSTSQNLRASFSSSTCMWALINRDSLIWFWLCWCMRYVPPPCYHHIIAQSVYSHHHWGSFTCDRQLERKKSNVLAMGSICFLHLPATETCTSILVLCLVCATLDDRKWYHFKSGGGGGGGRIWRCQNVERLKDGITQRVGREWEVYIDSGCHLSSAWCAECEERSKRRT